ncbi:MerR family transcriptional regulator [Nonomuraea sp. 3-1Str]|uniref:MerR family transcriptional regulator n=1 Tax=Nonomuraea sp. 3-1Str TaxID=2929801 RepID=UPI00285E5985|nr:MerR family transcriptional regulator [Nonomuraea sp. 3-1Str]MDR8408651.1 MerR family transcriptional regulator [Nonomuraea sp. 3-1Str]
MNDKEYTVGVVADLAGVSIRTLHHYDEIGLLEPQERNGAGYRLYSAGDVRKLQRILFYRELDFDLDTIGAILADPTLSDADRLHEQRRLLTERIERHQTMVAVIDKELAARRMGIALTPEERLEVFGSTRLEDNAEPAEQRWGDSPLWRQRHRRTSRYSAEDWREIRAEQSGIHQRLLEAMRTGIPADSATSMDLAEEHRLHMERRFHDCDYDTHRALAASYLANERIGLNFDDVAPGLSRYVHDAIIANADRAKADHS